MKFNVSHIVTLFTGLLIGLFVGFLLFGEKNEGNKIAEQSESVKIITKKVKDTVIVKKKVFIEVPISDTLSGTTLMDSSLVSDTLLGVQDTSSVINDDYVTIYNEKEEDEEDFDVITDKLLEKATTNLEIIEEQDSLNIESVLNKEVLPFNEILNIEFWSSPLDLTGYELSAKKLKLYGFNPSETIRARYTKGQDYIQFQIGDLSLKLKKTERFKTLYL